MGGINCNSPYTTNLDLVSSRVMDEYVHKLANYSANLFSGVASFYDANTKIELAVLGVADIVASIDTLGTSEDFIVECQASMSPVASLWSVVSPVNAVDFMSQSENLENALRAIRSARSELLGLPIDDDNLQAAIWGRPSVTDCLVEASRALSDAVEWQSRFATLSSSVMALAA